MITAQRVLLILLLLSGSDAAAQPTRREPHIGYLYPAGGRQKTTFRVTAGGQNLRGITDVYCTGEGVTAKVLQHYQPLRNLSAEERKLLVTTLRDLIADRWAELEKDGLVGSLPPWRELGLPPADRPRARRKPIPTSGPAEMPQHPLLYDLEHQSLRELLNILRQLAGLRKGQPNVQIAESVLIEVTIADDAPLGEREIRLGGQLGLTNPMVFEVGAWRETCELEDNDAPPPAWLPEEPPLKLPITLNGQIMPGDVDRFRFQARKDEGLVVETHARRLIPYLADAVPGWFQATVSVFDARDKEVAYADDYRFDPDPVLYYRVPADGEYVLEIRDSIYRGRQDFVYRVTVGQRPFITALYPLGTKTGHQRFAEILGWNLTTDKLFLDPEPDRAGLRQACLGAGKRTSNRVTYAVDVLPAKPEIEPNDSTADAQLAAMPGIVDGRIAAPGDVDLYRFKGRPGDEIVAEITARRLGSPLDSLLRLTDAEGQVLAWNDDSERKDGFLYKDMGVLTHGADSYIRARLPAKGTYYLQVSDAQAQGGPACGYRLRVGPPQPDFALRATPSSVNIPAAGAAVLTVYALRGDGFAGEIEVALDSAPEGFKLSGGRIPEGRDQIRVTLTAPRKRLDRPVVLQLIGRAKIGKQTVARPVVPAEDMMQAFLYRHLAPAQELMVAMQGARLPAIDLAVAGPTPIRIPPSGTAEVRINVPPRLLARGFELELSNPPPGVTLEKQTLAEKSVTLLLKADGQVVKSGYADNLIVEGFLRVDRPQDRGGKNNRQVRASAGYLPAIPFVISSQ